MGADKGDNQRAAAESPQVRAEADARLRSILDALPDLFFVIDREGRIHDYHSADSTPLYLPPEHFLGRTVAEVLPEPAARLILDALAATLAQGRMQQVVYSLPFPDGEHFFEASIAVRDDPRAADARLVFLAREITGRIRTEEALRASEEKYRLLTEGMKDVVWTLDVEARRFTYVSPSVLQLRGYTPEEILARPLEEAWAPHQRAELEEFTRRQVAAFLEGQLTDRDYVTFEILQPCKDGSLVPSEIVARIVRNEQTGRLEVHGVTRDISARRRAEEALRASEERFRNVAQVSRSYVWEVDGNGVYSFVSSAVKDVLGYRPDELVGKMHFADFHPPAGREEFRQETMAVFREGKPVTGFENLNVAKDGRRVWVSSSATPLFQADGTLRGYQGVDVDITVRKEAEDALRRSEARFAQNAFQTRTFVWEIDETGRYAYVSPVVQEILGYRPEEIVGRLHYYDLHPEKGREAFKAATLDMVRVASEIRDMENPMVAKDGRMVWVSSNAFPLRGPDGGLRGYWGSDMDITERKLAEEDLKTSETRYRELFDFAVDGILLGAPDGVITDANACMCALAGRTRQELVGRHVTELFTSETLDEAPLRFDRVDQGETVTCMRQITRPDGSDVFVEMHSKRMPDQTYQSIFHDITERKEAEEALRQSEAKYRNLHETMRDAFAAADMRGRIQEFNPAFRKLTGYSAAELRNKPFRAITPRKWHAREAQIVRDQVRTRGYSDVYEKEYVRKDGTVVPVELRTILIRDARGQPAGMWASIRDITQRKRAEDDLRGSEAKYRLLYENMRDAFASMDLQGRLQECNPAFEALVGYSRAEVQRLRLGDLTPPEWMAAEKRAIAQMRRRGYSKLFEKEYVRKDGTRVPVELRGSLLRDSRGKILGYWAIIRDISERKRAEAALRQAHDQLERRVAERTADLTASRQALAESEEQFRQMAENVKDAFWLIDARTQKVLYVNPAFKRIWNRPVRKEVARWFQHFHPDDRERIVQAFRHGMATGIPATVTFRLVWPDRSVRWVEASGSMIRDGRGRPLRAAGIIRDITDQRRLEEELLRATETERQRIGRDLHDGLGQSLTAIGYLADAVREELARQGRPEAREIEKLEHLLEQAAAESHALARGLLLADLQRGGIAAALQELAFRTQERLKLSCRYTGADAVALADANQAGQLYRIAQEAVTNAAKHSRARKIEIHLARRRAGLCLTVRDDGRGLSRTAGKGAGLGLDIMRYRAAIIGATLEIDSRRQRGTTVRCRLPRPAPKHPRKR